MSYTVTLEEDANGDLILPIPEEILNSMGWDVGTTLEWIDNGDGSFTLKEVTMETELVLVEAISQFRQRYVVEVPKGKADWALDTVTMEQAGEFSQLHLGEVITSHRVVSRDEVLALCDVDNNYCKSWTDDRKLETFVTWQKS